MVHYHFVPIWMKSDKQDDEISREMGILGLWPTLTHQFTCKLPTAEGNAASHVSWGRIVAHNQGEHSSILTSPWGSARLCILGRGPVPRGFRHHPQSWVPLHPPQPQTQWGCCEKQLPQLHFQAQVLQSWQRCLMVPTFQLCMLEWDGGDRQPRPSWILGCSRCCAAHSPPCPLFMTLVLGAMAGVVLLLLPSNTVSIKLNY